jgi:hypothetical protein
MKTAADFIIFSYMFFIVGMMTNAFTDAIDNGFASFGMMLIGVEVYLLLLLWFQYELKEMEQKRK